MIINVSQISEEEGLRVEHLYPRGEPTLRSEDRRIVDRPALDLRVTRSGKRVRFAGAVSAEVEIDCGRCLTPIRARVEEAFDLLYTPPLQSLDEHDERELAEEDLLVGFYQGDVIDLDDVVREQIELALPMTQLCSQDCRGLCAGCGTNLNEGYCACVTESVDPRWASLKDLKFD